nr:TIGR01212 family radical SAM protein [Thiospirillum jenense]
MSDFVNTFGTDLLRRYGERVHKLAIHAGFTCPNRDGSKGIGGCSFCNNQSFSPHARAAPSIAEQIDAGRRVLAKRTGAKRFIAYFQAYTNTYADIARLTDLYQQALAEPDVVGLSIGTRPDCVPTAVLELLASFRAAGYEIWLELGLQSACDATLRRVNRGHTFADYRHTLHAARAHGLLVCTHLIVGLPGENAAAAQASLAQVLALGTDGLKLHPLHVVTQTRLAAQWRAGQYQPWQLADYTAAVAELVARTPAEIVFHRLTGTASRDILLAPDWCAKKWVVLNGIERALRQRGYVQGCLAGEITRVGIHGNNWVNDEA